jgi:hypothetical protein
MIKTQQTKATSEGLRRYYTLTATASECQRTQSQQDGKDEGVIY